MDTHGIRRPFFAAIAAAAVPRSGASLLLTGTMPVPRAHPRNGTTPARARAAFLTLLLASNMLGVLWMWVHGGGLRVTSAGDILTSLGRLTALTGTYLLLVQVLLLARIPMMERAFGFERLALAHRRNGKLAVTLVLAHVPLIIAGYALTLHVPLDTEAAEVFTLFPGMVKAAIATGLLIAITVSSATFPRRRVPHELWYLIHLSAYAAILLGYFHQTPTGNEFVANTVQRDYWYALYAAAVALVIAFRMLPPLVGLLRHRLRVERVVHEAPGVVSIYMRGHALDRMRASGGQFMQWRFLTPGRFWQSHPFSLSAAPSEGQLRITVKGVGAFSRGLSTLRPGTRVCAEGPFGRFSAEQSRCERVLLVGGGIGIAPLRAMLDDLIARGRSIVVIQRASDADGLPLAGELAGYADRGLIELIQLLGPRRLADGTDVLAAEQLQRLVPDIDERETFVCGPAGLIDAVSASLIQAGVARRRIHSERFAFA